MHVLDGAVRDRFGATSSEREVASAAGAAQLSVWSLRRGASRGGAPVSSRNGVRCRSRGGDHSWISGPRGGRSTRWERAGQALRLRAHAPSGQRLRVASYDRCRAGWESRRGAAVAAGLRACVADLVSARVGNDPGARCLWGGQRMATRSDPSTCEPIASNRSVFTWRSSTSFRVSGTGGSEACCSAMLRSSPAPRAFERFR